jgi:hypothetical protein
MIVARWRRVQLSLLEIAALCKPLPLSTRGD